MKDLSAKGDRKMRIFCPEHGKGFFAPRRNPIKCENREHVMGELDFEGEARTPAETCWEYCCNCGHFFLFGASVDGIERCPACARQLFNRYLCDRCYLITCESNTPAQNKNFALTKEGLPQPTCPGCLQSPTTEVREHECDALGAVFVTAIVVCPMCEERLDVIPTFPALVTYYLKRTRKKVNVTFDYENEVFSPAEDGEYVVVRNGDDRELLLPRMPSFSSKRDFYAHYEDSFYCNDPKPGEVEVLEPGVVERVENGWKLNTHGLLRVETRRGKPKKKVALANGKSGNGALTNHSYIAPKPVKPVESAKTIAPDDARKPSKTEDLPAARDKQVLPTPIRAEEPGEMTRTPQSPNPTQQHVSPRAVTREVSSMITCSRCNSVQESKYSYCWHCGSPTGARQASASTPPPRTRFEQQMTAEEEITFSPEPPDADGTSPAIFAWALEENRPPAKKNSSSASLKLFSTLMLGVVILAVLLFVFIQRSSSKATSESPVSQQPAEQVQPAAQAQPAAAPTQAPKSLSAPDRAADAELQKIKNKKARAKGNGRDEILRALKSAESHYPSDYRFPYERAKLSFDPQDHRSNREAFDALTEAAQKAIAGGKADEMLASLTTDKQRDFSRLSRGHAEWQLVEQALRNKDKSKLR
jgi:hypothetical protein